MKKILLSCAMCLLALGLVSACDLDINTPNLEEDTSEEETDLTGSDDENLTSDEEDLTTEDEPEEFTIWAPYNAVNSIETLVNEFSTLYPEFGETYKVRIEVQGEGDAATNVIRDVTSAADIYFFAQDQTARLVQVGGLSAVPSSIREDVTSRNDSCSVKAGTSGDVLYAYPATSDNGYIVYYDKSVSGLEAEMTREGGPRQSELIKIAQQNNKQIDFELTSSGWYLASYFMATGCESTWYTDDSGAFVNCVDTWNSAAGLSALQGASELIRSGVFVNNSDGSVAFKGNAMLVVDGTWDAEVIRNRLGTNMGVAPLWTFDITGDGENSVEENKTETFQLGSFYGCKLVGVRPHTDGTKNGWAHLLANYLTDEHAQTLLHEEIGWGPSNAKVQATDAVKNDDVLQTLYQQHDLCSTVQGLYPNAWWDITVTLGSKIAALKTGYTNEDLWSLLKEYKEGIDKIIKSVPGDYVIVGSLADELQWNIDPSAGESKYCLYEDNADTGTYSKDSNGVIHGKWTVSLELAGGGCYVTSSGARGDSSSGDIELGLVRVCNYDDWFGNYGYSHLTDKTGFYDWDTLSGGSDNNIGALPGSYTFVFDYTGTTPAITMTSNAS